MDVYLSILVKSKKKKMSVCMAGVGEEGDPSREYRAYI